jgi:hypothetical protein
LIPPRDSRPTRKSPKYFRIGCQSHRKDRQRKSGRSGHLGVAVEELTNKTAIKEYHAHDFDQFLEVLKKNKKKLSIDPSERQKQEPLEQQFNKSMSVLGPVKAKIDATDELIDEIVYRLYGLTKEEMGIVKGENKQD